jgi:glycosyltransferase involved in cell wall biosynthesis
MSEVKSGKARRSVYSSKRNAIDVTVATKNSARTLDKCLQAIRANIPVRRLVIVDADSDDRTLAIAKKYDAIVVIEPGPLGRVRFVQAQNCGTDWIAYIDSDVYVYKSWWKEVSQYMGHEKVGMVLGFADAPVTTFPIYEAYLKHIARKFGTAAFSNTLVRRRLVLSCKDLLANIHAGEDTVLARHLDKLNSIIVTIPIALFYHDKAAVSDHPKAFYRWGQSSRLVGGKQGLKNLAKTLKNNIRNWWIFTFETKRLSLPLLAFLIYLWSWMLIGFVKTGDVR